MIETSHNPVFASRTSFIGKMRADCVPVGIGLFEALSSANTPSWLEVIHISKGGSGSALETVLLQNAAPRRASWGTIRYVRGKPRKAAGAFHGQRRTRRYSGYHDAEQASVRVASAALRAASSEARMVSAVRNASTLEGCRGRNSAVGIWMGER